MSSKLSSVRLSKSNELTIWTPDGHLTVALNRITAQAIAAGLQRNAGVPLDEKQMRLARFSSLIAVDEAKEHVASRRGIKLPSADEIRLAKMRERARRDAQR